MITNKPNDGEPIVTRVFDPILGERFIATPVFWRFLDEVVSIVSSTSDNLDNSLYPSILPQEADEGLVSLSISSFAGMKKFDIFTLSPAETAFTTTSDQIIICNNTAAATITLNSQPEDGEEVHIKRRQAAVTVSGSIDGGAFIRLLSRYDSLHLVYTAEAGEWSIL